MTDFVEDFLNEAALQLFDLESHLPALAKDLSREEGLNALYVFFDFIRSVAPFAGFLRLYRLADASLREIKECQKKGNILEALPAVLAKFQRIKEILVTSERLKREARESDDDLLPPADDNVSDFFVLNASKNMNVVRSGITAQETILDKREEELVLWAQALAEQENALKDKENILFKEERSQTVLQEKVSETLKRLNEQEKIQGELEECLASTRLTLQKCQEKLAVQENLQKHSEHLLEMKEAALNDTKQKNLELARQLAEEEKLKEEHEQQFFQELEKKQVQNKKLLDHLKLLEKTHFEVNENREKIFSQYALLEEEYQTIQRQLKEEKENKDQILQEKRELEKQHLDFSTLMLSLQEQLNVQEKSAKRFETQLKKQKYRYEALQSDLQVSGWPYDVGKLQKELAVLARQNKDETMTDSLAVLKEWIVQIRTHSFVKIPNFFKNIVHITAGRYKKPYEIDIKCDVVNGVDKDALSVLEQMLMELIENAFRHAFLKDGEVLHLSFSAWEKGTAVCCSFKDNGSSFDFDQLYNAVRATGLINKNISLSQQELLAYLFHNTVKGKTENRGLVKAVRLLEKSGGQVSADFKDGLQINFSIPKRFLFDNVLLFRLSDRLMAVPLNAVAETIFLKEEEIKMEKGGSGYFFYWKGISIPVLRLEKKEQNNFGLVIQAGAFSFLIPIQQVLDTEYILSFSDQKTKKKNPYLTPCTVLESGREPVFLDIEELLNQIVLPLPRKIISNAENESHNAETGVFYLIFKSEPAVFGAVRVDSILRVEDFVFSPKESVRKKFLETQGIRLPLRDSCPRDGYPHAQAVLIFEKFALAVQEVVDIIEIPNAETQESIDFIAYRGRKVSVFSEDL